MTLQGKAKIFCGVFIVSVFSHNSFFSVLSVVHIHCVIHFSYKIINITKSIFSFRFILMNNELMNYLKRLRSLLAITVTRRLKTYLLLTWITTSFVKIAWG